MSDIQRQPWITRPTAKLIVRRSELHPFPRIDHCLLFELKARTCFRASGRALRSLDLWPNIVQRYAKVDEREPQPYVVTGKRGKFCGLDDTQCRRLNLKAMTMTGKFKFHPDFYRQLTISHYCIQRRCHRRR